jgi:hypothetical protein
LIGLRSVRFVRLGCNECLVEIKISGFIVVVRSLKGSDDMTAPSQVVGRVKSKTTTASVLPSTSPPTTLEDRGKGNPRQQQQNTHVKLKVVVRGLPPNLPESLFKDTTKEWINETTVDWYYYVAGKLYERYAS